MRRAHEALVRSEREAAKTHGAHNVLLAGRLSALLDARKRLASRDGLEALAREYDVDVAKLESLARFVNVPDVRGAEDVRAVDKGGAERVTVKVKSARLGMIFWKLSRLLFFPFGRLLGQSQFSKPAPANRHSVQHAITFVFPTCRYYGTSYLFL